MKYLLLIACCGILMLIPPTTAQDSTSSTTSHEGVLASVNGRYVFGQVSPLRADQFMLDTQTGRLWQLMAATNNPEIGLVPIKYAVLISGEWVHSWGPIDEADAEARAAYKQKAGHP
jgi:hypothetical protein